MSVDNLPPTEQSGPLDHLETKSIGELVGSMHAHSEQAWRAVENCLPEIERFIEVLVQRMKQGGRLFYIGAGTSGRLGVLDASECPPTFGVEPDRVQGFISGGDGALRVAVEGAEDSETGAWKDLSPSQLTELDTIVGIAASGRTPYVVGGLKEAKARGLLTACIVCNPGSEAQKHADHSIIAISGAEFVTGSTRLNAGTATKLILNLISTITMIQLGHVQGSKMVDMKPSNSKLIDRGVRMIKEATSASDEEAFNALKSTGSVRLAIESLNDH